VANGDELLPKRESSDFKTLCITAALLIGAATMYRLIAPPSTAASERDLEAAGDQLRRAVLDARAFASVEQRWLVSWVSWFDNALQALESDEPESIPSGQPDYPRARERLNLPGRRLMAAAQRASVFGGMMSWNDNYFKDPAVQAEFMAVSKALGNAVYTAKATARKSPRR
jgi:hypothetical protein